VRNFVTPLFSCPCWAQCKSITAVGVGTHLSVVLANFSGHLSMAKITDYLPCRSMHTSSCEFFNTHRLGRLLAWNGIMTRQFESQALQNCSSPLCFPALYTPSQTFTSPSSSPNFGCGSDIPYRPCGLQPIPLQSYRSLQ
jgi:hypothetical protein